MNYEELYSEKIKLLDSQMENKKAKLDAVYKEYELSASDNTLLKKHDALNLLKKQIIKLEYDLYILKMEKKYARIGTRETEIEKQRIYNSFENDLKDVIGLDSDICFYGCRYIYFVKEILESGKIDTGIEKINFLNNDDSDNQISVSTIKTLDTTVKNYLGLNNSPSQRSGAMFVLIPKDESEIESSNRLVIGNIDFKENPERLLYIVTTNENKELLIKWCIDQDIPIEKVCTYDEFLNIALKFNNKTV